MNRQDLGLLIKKCREKRGLTQKQLAEIIGISAPCMSNIERGVNFPDIENFFAIVDALNISLDSLLKNESGSALLLADNKPYREKYNELSRESKLTVLHLIDDLWERNV